MKITLQEKVLKALYSEEFTAAFDNFFLVSISKEVLDPKIITNRQKAK